jgi:nucleoside-diphosphate-sugar epimerase
VIILITGANGALCRSMLKKLPKSFYLENKVFLTSRSLIHNGSNEITYFSCNISEKHEVESLLSSLRPQILVHFAWEVSTPNYLNHSSNIQWLEYSKNLFSLFVKYGGTKIISIGTLAEYDKNIEEIYIESLKSPSTLYGFCKLKLSEFLFENLDVNKNWVRIGSIFYLNNARRNSLHKIIDSVKKGDALKINDSVRPYLSIDRYGELLAAIMQKTKPNVSINLGANIPISTRSIVREIAEYFGDPDYLKKVSFVKPSKNFPFKYFVSPSDDKNLYFGNLDSANELKTFLNGLELPL